MLLEVRFPCTIFSWLWRQERPLTIPIAIFILVGHSTTISGPRAAGICLEISISDLLTYKLGYEIFVN
jgi:hypothetical protein